MVQESIHCQPWNCLKTVCDPFMRGLVILLFLNVFFPGFTQNANESVNSLVKIRCPKHKWHGRKRIELATASATLHFSAGATAKYEVMVRAGLAVGARTRKESRRDSGRIRKAEKRIQDQHKKYRVALRQAKQRDEEQWSQKEGTTCRCFQ